MSKQRNKARAQQRKMFTRKNPENVQAKTRKVRKMIEFYNH